MRPTTRRPSRPGRGVAVPVALVLLLLLVAAVPMASMGAVAAASTPGHGTIETEGPLHLTGTTEAVAGGEVAFRSATGASLVLEAARIRIQEVRAERTYTTAPTGQVVEGQNQPAEHTYHEYDGATVRLRAAHDGFRAMLATAELNATGAAPAPDEGLLRVHEDAYDAEPIVAYRDVPLLVSGSGGTDEEDKGTFGYRISGLRFPLPAREAEVGGDVIGFFVERGDLIVHDDGNPIIHSGEPWSEGDGVAGTTEGRSWFLVTAWDAQGVVRGDLDVWFREPTLQVVGEVTAATASGTIQFGEETVQAQDHELILTGAFQLVPRAAGAFVPGSDLARYGTTDDETSGHYAGVGAEMAGSLATLTFGTTSLVPTSAVPVALIAGGVGVLGLLGAAAVTTPSGKWLVLPALTPLYAKTQKDRLLDNRSRERIFQAICANPGINLSQVHRIAELGWGVTVYHLKMLEKNGIVFSRTRNRDRCFFENTPQNRTLVHAISAIANKEKVQQVARAVVASPGANQSELVEATGLSQRTASYHLTRLAKDGLVERRRVKNYVHYHPTDRLLAVLPIVTGQESDDDAPSPGDERLVTVASASATAAEATATA